LLGNPRGLAGELALARLGLEGVSAVATMRFLVES
jgi:hypothetical protein